ncbi:ABC transporter substrate-binding protein [Desulforhopalus sp. 52FAK]
MRNFFISSFTITLFFFCSTISQAEVVKIGAIFALSGKARASNDPAIRGVKLAMKEIAKIEEEQNSKRDIEIIFFDNESTPIGSHLAAMKAVEQNVSVIIGASWSSHSLSIARVAEKNGIPMISPISTIPSLTRIGDNIFRICYTDDFQGKAIATFAYLNLPSKTALIFTDIASDFSLNLSKTFKHTYTELGGEIVDIVEYKTVDGEFQAKLQQTQTLKADIAFLSGHDESGHIAKQLREAGIAAIPVGTDGWVAESFYTGGGDTISEGYYINHWAPCKTPKKWQWFIKSYSGKNRIMAPTALAFDAVMLAAEAIKNSPTTARSDIRNTIHNIQNYEGLTGVIRFDQTGDALKGACINKITDGRSSHLECVSPSLSETAWSP